MSVIQNKIAHVLHNYGGGTEIYVDNMINIFNQYLHIKIKIISENLYKIDDTINIIDNNKIKEYLISNNIKFIFVHHLLYCDYEHKINKNLIECIRTLNIPKFFIVHDFHLLYPDNPNPIELNLKNPDNYNIEYCKYIFSLFDKIFFNSNSCYNKYNKYLHVNNKIILKNVPDINTDNPRIYKKINNRKCNIGILGHICNEHKGKSLVESIFKMFECNDKYQFKVFGNYNLTSNNVINFGIYSNDTIFNLIEKENIDCFLFVSRFAETYSFCLSIAIKTGLPIIYNNIGAYIDRLQSYNNCYPFDELDIIKISNSLEYIINNTIEYNENKYNYKLIEGVEEFNL